MEKNVGKTDRVIRVIIGLLALVLAWIYSPWWLIIAIIALTTAATQKCPAYSLLKGKDKPVKQPNKKKK
jgi:hypothetical protein